MHGIGFVHRDIKPDNILLGFRDRELKIGDFGLSCWAVTGNELLDESVGTLNYLPPENILTRGKYGKKMDVWAAGCVLFQMAVGGIKPLFVGSNKFDQMKSIEKVLGRPDHRLLHRLQKFQSFVFFKRYLDPNADDSVITIGTGLKSVYSPFKPGYELFKDMIVCDPAKRFSACQLLRKPYFWELQHTPHDHRIIEFEEKQ